MVVCGVGEEKKGAGPMPPPASSLADWACGCCGVWGQAAFKHLQLVVFGKVHDEIPGHGFGVAQVGVHDDDFHTIHDGGNAPGGIRDVAANGDPATARAKLAHDAGQTLCPVAGAERAPTPGNTLDEHLLGGGSDGHGVAAVLRSVPRVEGGGCCGLATPPGEAAFQMPVLYLI